MGALFYPAHPRLHLADLVPVLAEEKRFPCLQGLDLIRVRDKAARPPDRPHIRRPGLAHLRRVFKLVRGADDRGKFFGILGRVLPVQDEVVAVADHLIDKMIRVIFPARRYIRKALR